MTWTRFMDMNSGGGRKHGAEFIYIEAPEAEASAVFYARFGSNPNRVTCTCCGPDYSITECESLEKATAFERNCRYDEVAQAYVEEQETRIRAYCSSEAEWQDYLQRRGRYVALADYVKRDNIIVVGADDITDEQRRAVVPSQDYMWVD